MCSCNTSVRPEPHPATPRSCIVKYITATTTAPAISLPYTSLASLVQSVHPRAKTCVMTTVPAISLPYTSLASLVQSVHPRAKTCVMTTVPAISLLCTSLASLVQSVHPRIKTCVMTTVPAISLLCTSLASPHTVSPSTRQDLCYDDGTGHLSTLYLFSVPSYSLSIHASRLVL